MPATVSASSNQLSALRKPGTGAAPMPSEARPLTTPSPPSTHSTIRAQLRPFQANQMNIACSADEDQADDAADDDGAAQHVVARRSRRRPRRAAPRPRGCRSSRTRSIEPMIPRIRLAMNAPMPARTANGRSTGGARRSPSAPTVRARSPGTAPAAAGGAFQPWPGSAGPPAAASRAGRPGSRPDLTVMTRLPLRRAVAARCPSSTAIMAHARGHAGGRSPAPRVTRVRFSRG